jgi:hypothetical protein
MKSSLKFLVTLFFVLNGVLGWGQVTHTFTSTSGAIDSNISFTTQQNSSGTAPAFNTNLRLYYASNGNGCSITLTPTNGITITQVKLFGVTSYTPTVKYNSDGGADVTASLSGTTYTISSISAISSLKIRNGNTTNTQLRLTGIEVTYFAACTAPTTQASNFISSTITENTATIGWTRGNGTGGVLVVAKEATSVDADPVSGTTYSANAAFGSGDVIGTNNFVVYNGTGNSVNLTGLSAGTTYHFAIYEYDTTDICFNKSELTGNFTTSLAGGCTPFLTEGLNNSSTLFTLSGGSYYTGNSGIGDRPASSPFAVEGSHSRGITDGTAILTSDNINTSTYSGVDLTFRLASFSIASTANGADVGDYVKVEISPNGGTTWYNTLQVKGNSNAYWAYSSGNGAAETAYDGDVTAVDFQPAGGGNRTTDGYSNVRITGLPISTNMKIRVTLMNNDTGERWLVDNFILCGIVNNDPQLSITGTLNEGTLNTATVSLTLANDAFVDGTFLSSNFTLNNAPTGVSISSVVWNSSTTATVTLAYDGTDFDANVTNFNIGIAGTELTSTAALTSNNLTITALTETLTVSGGTLAFGTVCNGSTSTELSFTISGSNLKSGNISLAVFSGYSYSETSGGTFTSTLSFSQTGGTLAAKTIYVKLTPLAANQTYNGDIGVSGGGADSVNKAVTGNSTVATQAVTTNVASSILVTSATLNGNITVLGTCPNTVSKGFVYSSVETTPENGELNVNIQPVSGLTTGAYNYGLTGLSGGTTYYFQSYVYDGTSYIYGGVQTFQTSVTAPTNVTNTKACLTDNGGIISWTAPSTAPYGYMVFAVAATTAGTGSPTTPIADYATVNADFSVATTYASLGKLLYKGSATSVSITGLTENTSYSFRVFSYNQGSEIRNFSSGSTVGSIAENTLAQDDVKTFTGTPSSNQVTLNWTYNGATSCFDEVIIVANQGAVALTPSGDGSAYIADDTWNGAGDQVVYKGSANSKAVTGFVNGTEYCFKIFVRRGSNWSDGTSVCVTPDISYCDTANGSTTTNSGILNVSLGSINNTSISTEAYTDFTSISTIVNIGQDYPLSVIVNTGGDYISYVKVWIDWNHDGDFNGSNESYELGIITNSTNGSPSASPFTITVPATAYIGSTRMRVSAKTDSGESYATSCENFSYGEVEDYTINISYSNEQEIRITGEGISIPNGFDAPYGLNNTLFPGTNLGSESVEKEFIIENLGLADLLLTGTPIIQLEGDHPGDFVVTQQASSPVTTSSSTTFKIKFVPSVSGVRSAYVKIINNDSDENPFEFKIQGTGICTNTYTTTFLPNSGPSHTMVTVTTDADLTGATITYNEQTLTPIALEATSASIQIPDNATSDFITITLANGCTITQYFNVISSVNTSCATSGAVETSDNLFISQVTDSGTDAMTYIELFNNTGSNVNLNGFSFKIYNNGTSSPTNTINLNNVNLADQATYVVVIGNSSPACTEVVGGEGELADQTLSGLGGVNFETGKNDYIALFDGTTKIDSWGEYESDTWADGLNLGGKGAHFSRKNTATVPSVTYSHEDWNITDWGDTCDTQDYSTIGTFVFASNVLPDITNQATTLPTCESVIFTVTATEGVADSTDLAYQWYVLPSGSGTWTALSNTGVYSGVATNALTISSTSGLNNYQYYCQVKEDGVTCYVASNALIVKGATTWTSTGWSNFEPDATRVVIIDENYSTSTNGNLNACSLTINTNKTLTINESDFAYVLNQIVNNGTIIVDHTGSLVQVNETDTNTGAGVYRIKKTTGGYYQYDYIYWSSPIENQNIENVFKTADGFNNYKYKLVPQAYNDTRSGRRTGSTQPTAGIADGFDDEGDDWTSFATGTMEEGLGYIVMGKGSVFPFSIANASGAVSGYNVEFSGNKVNNAEVLVKLHKDNFTGTDANNVNLNLVGNPYPSAIDIKEVFKVNKDNILGNFAFWTHDTPIAAIGGPYAYDFSNSSFDYGNVVENAGVYTFTPASGSNAAFENIASGQGFLVSAKETIATGVTELKFNNSMREASLPNTSFLKQSKNEEVSLNRIWLSMTQGTQIQRGIAIGFGVDLSDDMGMGDMPRVDSANDTDFYSLIDGQNGGFSIQFLGEFNVNKEIPLGIEILNSGTYQIQIEQFEGIFTQDQKIYLEDTYEDVIHNLNEGAYSFTQTAGTNINERFILRFTNTTLGNDDTALNTVKVYPNPSTGVFNVSYQGSATLQYTVYDLTGKTILSGTGNQIDLSRQAIGMYFAKITDGSAVRSLKLVRE